MTDQSTLARHAALVDDMGHALGVDLEEEVLRGSLATDALVDAVLSCTNCTNPSQCRSWLNKQEKTVDATPNYCRNSDLLLPLRDAAAKR